MGPEGTAAVPLFLRLPGERTMDLMVIGEAFSLGLILGVVLGLALWLVILPALATARRRGP